MPAEKYKIEILESIDISLCNELADLQRDIWKLDDVDIMPPWKLLVIPKTGGVIAVAFESKKPLGLAVLTPAIVDNERGFYADMMGVSPKHQDSSLGTAMMQKVSAFIGENAKIWWTYDPLEGRNANLFIGKIGAIATGYLENYYGNLSGIDAEVPTDRFWVELSTGTEKKLFEKPAATIRLDGYTDHEKLLKGLPSPIAIEIPRSLKELKQRDVKSALNLRLATRKIFQTLFSHGYIVSGFYRENGKNFYVAERG